MAQAAIAAGAEFLVTPAFLPDVILIGRGAGVPVVSGAFTPTEILGAWRAGADLVKVFPAGGVGPAYIKDVLGPLPTIPLVPTGGVNLGNWQHFLPPVPTPWQLGAASSTKNWCADRIGLR